MISFQVSEEVKERVRCYFTEHLPLYEVIEVGHSWDYMYRVLAKYVGNNEFKKGTFMYISWNDSIKSANSGYYDLSEKLATNAFLGVVTKIEFARMDEIATTALHKILDYDPDIAAELILDDLELDSGELNYFEINKADLEPKEE